MGSNPSKVQYIHAVPVYKDDDGAMVFRNPDAVEELIEETDEAVHSIYSLFYRSRNAFKRSNCLGTKKKVNG